MPYFLVRSRWHDVCWPVVMTQPRSILAGATYLITRRVLRRHMLLRPDAEMTNLIIYALAVSAERFCIDIHALCAMSTHIHIVATDQHGELPRFLQSFHRIVALATKEMRDWEGPVWDHEQTSVVHLTTREAVVEKVAYTILNPVSAGLVQHASDWPGAKVLVTDLGTGVLKATRPSTYFDPKNPNWPAEASLKITLPPAIEQEHASAYRRVVAAEVLRHEAAACEAAGERGVLGAELAGRVSPHERATTIEPKGQRNPSFAAGRGNNEGWRRAAAGLRAFRDAYRAALDQWRAGARSVLFPAGTWWMRVLHGASVSNVALAA